MNRNKIKQDIGMLKEDMMNMKLEANVSRSEAIRRYLISAALIGAVLVSPATVPSWIALVACYPAFTALLQWDPVNVMCQGIVNQLSSTARNALFRSTKVIRN